MKIALAALVVFIVGIVYIAPFVMSEKSCYDNSLSSINDIQYQVASRGIGKERVCERRIVVLDELEGCLKKATGSGQIVRYAYPIIEGSLSMVRPMSKALQSLKSEHDLECEDYPDYTTGSFVPSP